MTRIVAGAAGGRRLSVPAGQQTRPTSDRAREGLFGTVRAVLGSLDGASVLDLYAGSGAVALEALSRGAAFALLVESDPRAIRAIRANIAALGLPGAHLAAGQVERVLARGPGGLSLPVPDGGGERRFDLVFADPPYAAAGEEIAAILTALASRGWLAAGALVAVERGSRAGPVPWPPGYAPDRSRRYGEATLWYGLATSGRSA